MNPPARLAASALAALWERMPLAVKNAALLLRESAYTVTVMAVIHDDRGRVLLLEHRFRGGSWALPGGFVARGEQPDDAARREALEEAGLAVGDLDLVCARALYHNPRIELVFRGRAACAPRPDGFEITAARWVPAEDLALHVPPDLHEIICRALGPIEGGIAPRCDVQDRAGAGDRGQESHERPGDLQG